MSEFFSNRCRSCAGLQECPEKMISLFEKSVSEMFTHCTSLEIDYNDSLPSHICFECFGHLSNFNKFKKNCIDSDTYFRKQICTESIKVEPLHETSVKCEENGSNEELESEFYDTEYIDENFSQYDPDLTVQNSVASADIIDLGAFDDKFICDYCGQHFDRKNQIASHMIKHKTKAKRRVVVATGDVEKVKIYCPQCPKWFPMQIRLDGHIRSKHEGLKPYKCPHCEKDFCKYRSYTHHVRFRHSDDQKEKFHCSYDGCDKEYVVLDSLRTHINRSHLGMIPEKRNQKLICEQCGRSFTNGFSLKEHSYSHSGIMPFACKMCPRKFISKYKLKIHTMRHLNDKPFECPTCGLRKTTRKELREHLNFHTKEKTYPCKECPRVFASYSASNRHVRIHHRNHKPYICPHCQRAFAKAETMKNHVMTHTGEKPFACSVCGHRFIQSVALKAHMKVHTKKLS